MAKITFNTFKEACEFSKHIAVTTKSTSAVHREGDIWWVEDQSNVQSNYEESKSVVKEKISDLNIEPTINKDEVKKEGSNDGYILCPVNGYVKMVGGFWVDRNGERVDTGKYARTIKVVGRTRTAWNTPTATNSYMDGDNHID